MDDGISGKAWNGKPEGASIRSLYTALFYSLAILLAVFFRKTLAMPGLSTHTFQNGLTP